MGGFIFLSPTIMSFQQQIQVQWTTLNILSYKEDDYISLTDMVKKFGDEFMIYGWMRNRNTVEFLGLREIINNPDFKPIEFDRFKKDAWLNKFAMSPKKWIDATSAIWIMTKSWRYGWGTYAHKDIAFEFASWLSPEFKLYLIKEFQRLKAQENKSLDRNIKRMISKMNYKIHTDAIQQHLIPHVLSKSEIIYVYADEADVLNKALFGMTAKERRSNHPKKPWNIRDEATIQQLIVLANIESINAEFIKMGMTQSERLPLFNKISIDQMTSLLGIKHLPKIEKK